MDDHYRTLGVTPAATAEEIRSAYLALMKLYHPDALRRSASDEAEQKAQALNRAYSVLRDPEQRAAYDSELKLRVAAAAPLHRRMPATVGGPFPAPRPRPSSRSARAVALTLLAAAAGALIALLATGGPEIARREGLARLVEDEPKPKRRKVPQPPIDSRLVIDAGSDAEFIFLNGLPADAVLFSRGCFDELLEMPTLKLLDRCVAFDLAASRWLAITKKGHETSFFSAPEMTSRHGEAFGRLAFGAEAREERLETLDQLAVTEIALRLNQP